MAGAFSLFHPYEVDGEELVGGEQCGVEWVGEGVGVGGGELVGGGGGGGVFESDVVEDARAGRNRCEYGLVGGEEAVDLEDVSKKVGEGHGGLVDEGGHKVFAAYALDAGAQNVYLGRLEVIVDEVKRGFDWGGMVDDSVMVGVIVWVTMVEVVVDEGRGADDVLPDRAVDVEEEVIGVDVEAEDGGRVVEHEYAKPRAMLSIESGLVRMPDISMLDDSAMVVGEEAVVAAEEVAAEVVAADEVKAAATAAAAAGSAAVC
ncbi:hypothetical protein CBR_g23931 [Chara braunii]|uniref:Uncharacterized protein n=1 Tax=Chara braunii TaxID=69332 RepID=A0A388L5A5_CHABU|nr:hypothetical protein CBR_g23931 [Chara braunii]|eukprot:GBG77484.1 hypothetical protein CBR_g23931 [Chara braunii]